MTIRRGQRGEKVKVLQRALAIRGLSVEDDGIFGGDTFTAVEAFQRQNGLAVDGIAGPDTLSALGLDPDTLNPVTGSEPSPGVDTEVITFIEADVTVPPTLQQGMREFAARAEEVSKQLLTSTLNALDQFETTMGHASASHAEPGALGSLVSSAVGAAVDALVGQVPGLSVAASLYAAVTDELERAGNAGSDLQMGDWVKDQRAVLDRSLRAEDSEAFLFELEEGYLDLDPTGREHFADQLFEDSQRLQGVTLVDIDELECAFYEEWINAHFRAISDDAQGCIQFRYEFDENTFDFVSCEVRAPSGDKIESAMNRLLDGGRIPRVQRPIDLKVRKQATFWVDNFVGGKSWSSGWLGLDNETVHTPVHPPAVDALRDPAWRLVKRFKRE